MNAVAPRSLGRVLQIFDALAKSPSGLSLAEISLLLESPKSSLLNLLKPLVQQGFLSHENARYQLGPAAFRLASAILGSRKLSFVLRPYLEELARESRETAFIATLDKETRMVTYIDAIDSPQLIRYTVPIGSTRPIYSTAAGRVLLAFASEEWRESYLKTEKLKPLTRSTPVNRSELRERLAGIRRVGYEVSLGDTVDDVGGLAAAVKGSDGEVDAVLLVAGPMPRFKRELPRLKSLIVRLAEKASGRNDMELN